MAKKVRRVRVTVAKQRKKKEITALGQVIRSLGSLGGGALGSLVGQAQGGASLGNSLGAALSRWLGAGDYKVSQNSLVQKAAASIPMMHNTGQTVVVRHKEFLATISGSSSFSVQHEFALNPGVSNTFPWLSTIANSFSEYTIKGLVFHYVPTSGMAVSSTNSALGSVMIQTTYRASDSPPSSKHEILNEYWSNEVVPSETMCHPLECDPKENPFQVHYVRAGEIPDGDTILMYDLGKTYVAVQGMQSTNVVGDLWVTYEVELKKPIISSNVSESLSYRNRFTGYSPALGYFGGPTSGPIGTLPLTVNMNSLVFPVGTYGIFDIEVMIVPTTTFAVASGAFNANPVFENMEFYAEGVDGYGMFVAGTTASTGTQGILHYTTSVAKRTRESIGTVTIPALSGFGGTTAHVSVFVNYSGPFTS
jgi:outer membrane lipoprotein SlyB